MSSKGGTYQPRLYDLTTLQREANRLFGFTAEDIMDFWQHKAPQKYSAFELAFELGHRVIAELILNTLNKMAESFGFTDNPRYIAEKNYMEALLKKASPHTVR